MRWLFTFRMMKKIYTYWDADNIQRLVIALSKKQVREAFNVKVVEFYGYLNKGNNQFNKLIKTVLP